MLDKMIDPDPFMDQIQAENDFIKINKMHNQKHPYKGKMSKVSQNESNGEADTDCTD